MKSLRKACSLPGSNLGREEIEDMSGIFAIQLYNGLDYAPRVLSPMIVPYLCNHASIYTACYIIRHSFLPCNASYGTLSFLAMHHAALFPSLQYIMRHSFLPCNDHCGNRIPERGALAGPNKGMTKLQSIVQGTPAAPLPSVSVTAMSPLHEQGHTSWRSRKKVHGARCYVLCCLLKHVLRGPCLWRKLDYLVTMGCASAGQRQPKEQQKRLPGLNLLLECC
eukprot:1162099-Pelagomonas_calceolata.AAC.3